MEKEKKSEIHITNNFNAPIGQHIDHVDTINFRMDGDGNFHFGIVDNVKKEKPCEEGDEEDTHEVLHGENKTNEEDLVSKLMPIFYNNVEDVRRFLKEIRGMESQDITDLVNRWVKDKRISDYGNSRKGVLWGILHEAGLYTKTKTNWNERVR